MRPEAASAVRTRTLRLGRRTHKGVLVVHIASAGAWIGVDVVLAVLVFTALLSDDVHTRSLCYQALTLFAIWPLLGAGLVSLASGLLLGLGTTYGLLRYWWVATKLVLNLLLSGLVLVALRPLVAQASEYGRQLAEGQPAGAAPSDLIFPPIVSPAALLIAVILAVYKPWGRIRKRRA
jgi:hypothetical protein